MNTATNNDLKELKDLITQLNDRTETRFNEVDRKIEKLSEDVNETKIDIATISAKFNSELRTPNSELRWCWVTLSLTQPTVIEGAFS